MRAVVNFCAGILMLLVGVNLLLLFGFSLLGMFFGLAGFALMHRYRSPALEEVRKETGKAVGFIRKAAVAVGIGSVGTGVVGLIASDRGGIFRILTLCLCGAVILAGLVCLVSGLMLIRVSEERKCLLRKGSWRS